MPLASSGVIPACTRVGMEMHDMPPWLSGSWHLTWGSDGVDIAVWAPDSDRVAGGHGIGAGGRVKSC